ncbi:hypothetical protein [Nonomuraea sp. NPDC050786]|uniref:hypothetical protein n=1 Tax=Nonomuraea sp. NPDC050786 TaxID=3154840 RepID=UPI0033F3AB9F
MTGTLALVRLMLRRDRVLLRIWIAIGAAASPVAPLLGPAAVAATLAAAGPAFLRRRDLVPSA